MNSLVIFVIWLFCIGFASATGCKWGWFYGVMLGPVGVIVAAIMRANELKAAELQAVKAMAEDIGEIKNSVDGICNGMQYLCDNIPAKQ